MGLARLNMDLSEAIIDWIVVIINMNESIKKPNPNYTSRKGSFRVVSTRLIPDLKTKHIRAYIGRINS